MKKAKFALTAVALLAFIGGALAFKANRQLHDFFAYTTTLDLGKVTGACIPVTQLSYAVNPAGTVNITVSSAQVIGITTCKARVIKSL